MPGSRNFFSRRAQTGATVIEYVIAAVLIAVVALVAIDTVGEQTRIRMDHVASNLDAI